LANKQYKPTSPGRRSMTVHDFSELTKGKNPEKKLLRIKKRSGGRNNKGRMTNINIGGGHRRKIRQIDFKRDKDSITAKVIAIEYDPNRNARLALLSYIDGEKRYILCPEEVKRGSILVSGPQADILPGNALPIKNIPLGTIIHSVELKPGAGAKLVRSAGAFAQLMAKEGERAQIKLPSGEVRLVPLDCKATIGQVGNIESNKANLGKAGRSRWLGRRPHVRGVVKNPVDHPHGGGEGRSSGGRHPCSPKGIPTKGWRTRRNRRTDKDIIKRRGKK